VVISTRDRPEYVLSCLQSLVYQEGGWDLFVCVMDEDPSYLRNNWLFNKTLNRLYHQGHSWFIEYRRGKNQLVGFQAGLEFASGRGHELTVITDDDIMFKPGWIDSIQRDHRSIPEAAAIAGITLLPWEPESIQGAPEWFLEHPDYQGRADENSHYYHCTMWPPWKEPREYEQLYGAFMCKTRDFIEVGGFPQFLSPAGCRGEQWPMIACHNGGKKLLVDPLARSFHYSAPVGGLRWMSPEKKAEYQREDFRLFGEWLKSRPSRVDSPRNASGADAR
jgi:hypothetical protein